MRDSARRFLSGTLFDIRHKRAVRQFDLYLGRCTKVVHPRGIFFSARKRCKQDSLVVRFCQHQWNQPDSARLSAHRMKNHHRVLCEHGHFPAVGSELLNNLLIKRLHIHARPLDSAFD